MDLSSDDCQGCSHTLDSHRNPAQSPAFTVEKAGGAVVAKQLTGSPGTGVSILETPLSANTTLESFHWANIPVKLQRFIKAATDTGGYPTDIQAIVVGDSVVSVLERTANGGGLSGQPFTRWYWSGHYVDHRRASYVCPGV